jgi:hypothetical protein
MGLGSTLIRLVSLLLPNMKVNELIRRLCKPDVPAPDPEVAPKIVEWTFRVENVCNIVCEVRLPAQRARLCYEEQGTKR